MKRIHVGMWCIDTVSKQNLGTQLRLKMLADELEKFSAHCLRIEGEIEKDLSRKDRELNRQRKMNAIFIAPENLFCRPLTEDRGFKYGDVRQLSETQKNEILRSLKVLSKKYPKMLIIPGSISWKKSIDRPVGAEKPWWQQIATANPFAALADPEPTRREKSILRVKANRRTLGIGRDEPLSDEFGFVNDSTPAFTPREKVENLAHATAIAKNTSYVLFNGELLVKYNKSSDFHEVLDGAETVFIPGAVAARFKCDDVLFGLDICMDNNYASLQEEASEVDIHVLISAATEGDPSNARLEEGGWFIHCSSNTLYYELNQKGFGRLPSDAIVKSGDLKCADILVFESAAEVAVVKFLRGPVQED